MVCSRFTGVLLLPFLYIYYSRYLLLTGRYRYQWEPESVVALKISNTNSGAAEGEREIEEYIAQKDPSHRGRALFRTSTECFEITGPEGRHLCLAYEPMREPIWLYQRRFRDRIIPIQIVKTYIYFFLVGLDYLHTSCRIVHIGNVSPQTCLGTSMALAIPRLTIQILYKPKTRKYHDHIRRPVRTR